MANTEYQTQCFVKIDGADVSKEIMADLIEVVVDSSLHLPDLFTIKVNESTVELKWVDDARFDIGKQVEISIKSGSELRRRGHPHQGGDHSFGATLSS